MSPVMNRPVLCDLHQPTSAIIADVPKELLKQDVTALDCSDRLLALGGLVVYCATANKLPHVMREIGRLRETAFRAVGEGTDRAFDLDEFDPH